MVKSNTTIKLKKCISQYLFFNGFKKNLDYTLSNDQLIIKNMVVKDKIIKVLRDFSPNQHYYWETPRILRWF